MIIMIIVMMCELLWHYAGTLLSASWVPAPAPSLFLHYRGHRQEKDATTPANNRQKVVVGVIVVVDVDV